MKGVLLLLNVPFRTPATQAIFLWKEFLLRSLHIFVKLCKLGSKRQVSAQDIRSQSTRTGPSCSKRG